MCVASLTFPIAQESFHHAVCNLTSLRWTDRMYHLRLIEPRRWLVPHLVDPTRIAQVRNRARIALSAHALGANFLDDFAHVIAKLPTTLQLVQTTYSPLVLLC